MNKLLISIMLFAFTSLYANQTLVSPDKKLSIVVNPQAKSFSFTVENKMYLKQIEYDLIFNQKSVLGNKVKRITQKSETLNTIPTLSYKNASITTSANTMSIEYSNGNIIEFKLFNDGFAYRFKTKNKGIVEVNEKLQVQFSENVNMWTSPLSAGNFASTYENVFIETSLQNFSEDEHTYLPLLVSNTKKQKILITDVDVFDYPNTFLQKSTTKENTLEAAFPPYPIETELIGDRRSKVTKTADYIAKTTGSRTFPWRVFVYAENDIDLLQSNLCYVLAEDKRFTDTSWIKPGRVAWDWWNSVNLKSVNFISGFNTDTYKYYIDFASNNGLEYVILDEGWSVSTTDISMPRSDLDLFELIAYAKKKNVDLILWASWRAIEDQFFVLERYSKWGIKGIKVDFMDRADQWMVNFYERVAKEAAKHKLLVNFHGAYKPTGLHKTYPNVITFEGVMGLEHNKWSNDRITPKHNLTLPFTRMVVGPMDYTPGAMRNFHEKEYKFNFHRPGSMTTRAHEVATFVIFESPLQMLADSPTNYETEKETTEFIAKIPSTWDEIKVLHAEIGKYIILARRKGAKWYIAGINNNDIKREFDLDISFLKKQNISYEIFKDGINSDRHAEDYRYNKNIISSSNSIKVTMNSGGGFVIIL